MIPTYAFHHDSILKIASWAAFVLIACGVVPLSGQGQEPGTQQRPSPTVFVDSIAVDGNVRQTRDLIVGTTGLQAGSSMTFRDIQRAVKNLWSTGQFKDVQVRALGRVGEPVVLVFDVEEQELIRRVTIRGLEHGDPGEVRDTTDLRPGTPYSPVRVARAKEYIRSDLARQGIAFARIEERIEPIPDRDNEIEIVLEVTEGNRVTVAQVVFTGNEAFETEQLRGAMSTKPEGFWWFRSGSYDELTFEEDLESRLPDFYGRNGFLDFQVLRDTLVVDPQTGKARIEISVEEGRRYRVGSFEIEGNRRFPTDQLEQYFQTERGGLLRSLGFGGGEVGGKPVFDAEAFRSATQRVEELYRNEGYLYARVQPFIEKSEPTEEGASPEVQVGWRIAEGEPAYVNRVMVAGNDFTYERVVREKIFLLPGDVYSQQRLIQSYQSISSLGFFETPMEFPTIEPDPETGDVDITFHVKEKQTGSINFGTAVGGGTGVAGFLGYDQPNLFGQAKSGSLRWDFGRWANNFSISFTDPALFQSQVSGTFSLFDSRDRFFRFSTGERKRRGGLMRYGFPVPGSLRSRFLVGYSLSRTKYELRDNVDDTSLFGRPPGVQSQLSFGLLRQTLNHPLFPTTGSRQSLNAELNGGLLGGDGEFVKTTADGSWFVPVGQIGGGGPGGGGIQLALGLSVNGGAIFGNAERFPFDQFWMGGVQFGQRLRGYEETTITPLGYFDRSSREIADIDRLGNAFLLLTAEYAVRFNDNLSLSLFYDAGNVWREPSDVDPTRLFRGAGLGLQLVTPFGPLGLDYAYGFDKDDPGWQLHFRLGPGF